MKPDDAKRDAERRFGRFRGIRESGYDIRGGGWLQAVWQDLRYGMRTLGRSPGFTLAAMMILALAIGANTAIFSLVHTALLRPLPYAEPDGLFSIEVVLPELADRFPSLAPRILDYLEWRRAATTFSAVAALTPASWNLTGGDEPERIGGARVSSNFFTTLGVDMAYGRSFVPEEETPGNDLVVVISHELWSRRYGADPTLIDKTIFLNGQSHEVVGIAPPSLLVPTGTQLHPTMQFAPRVDVWKPLALAENELQGENWNYGVIARIDPGGDIERGRQQVSVLLDASFRSSFPQMEVTPAARLVPIREVYSGAVRGRLLLVFAASALLLTIAWVNVANLMLTRAVGRYRELALRVALGAGRRRTLTHSLAESMLLALGGGAAGIGLAYVGSYGLIVFAPPSMPFLAETQINAAALVFAVFVSLATGAACGLVPAWQAGRRNPEMALREGARQVDEGRRSYGFRQMLSGVEIALVTVLLVAAGLLLHSFVNLMHSDRGYEIERVLTVELALPGQQYTDGAGRMAFYSELTERIGALPGVLAVGAISDLPAVRDSGTSQIYLDTDAPQALDMGMLLERPIAGTRTAMPAYFAASGSPLLAGRFFTEADQTPVAVVSQTLATQLWPGEELANIVNRNIRQGDVNGPLVTVVGVVGDTRPGALDDRALPWQIYRPHHQAARGAMTVVVRTAQSPELLAPVVRREVRGMDANLPIPSLRTMREIVSDSIAPQRFQLLLFSLFGWVSLLLGVVGVYGVVSYAVACRTRDIGLRVALGATHRDIWRWVFLHGMRPVVTGLVVGLIGGGILAQSLRSFLFEVAPADPLSFGAVTLVLLLTSALACYFPARRAGRLDPMTALRCE